MRSTCVRRDQLRPMHDDVHLVEEDLLAGLLDQRVRAECGLFHKSNLADRSQPVEVGVTLSF